MNTLHFQNMLALMDIYAFFQKCEITSVNKGKFFKNTTDIETPQSVNGDDSLDNAP
jgi:hypothetical protein